MEGRGEGRLVGWWGAVVGGKGREKTGKKVRIGLRDRADAVTDPTGRYRSPERGRASRQWRGLDFERGFKLSINQHHDDFAGHGGR